MKDKLLLLGDEAIAQAALDAGLSGVYAYPGTPSTEITETIQASPEAAERGVHSAWSANEKTAMEEALGMSFAGRRAMACMKHVGLNVAADPFVNAAITGVQGGLVVVVADDPSMHSSQNEQDSRFYGRFAMIPFLEPGNQQEAYDMVYAAFDLSEKAGTPVMVRITTRLAHSRADVVRAAVKPPRPLNPCSESQRFTLLPGNARRQYDALVARQADFAAWAEASPYNGLSGGTDRSVGIVASGLAANYVKECFRNDPLPYPLLRIGQYPLPAGLVKKLAAACDELLVVEEGAPFIEEALRGVLPGPHRIRGRLDGALPRTGELSPDALAAALGMETPEPQPAPAEIRPRPPQLCRGCPHIDSYLFIKEALAGQPEARVFADIGCYTLGALPPFEAIHTCVDMGAAITMAKGAADAGLHPSVAVIGDSTFMHSGLTGLLDCVSENTRLTLLILDNDTTGMTGRQESLASGRLESAICGLGVPPEQCQVLVPLRKHHEENVAALQRAIAHPGVSVVIARRPCIHLKRSM